MSEHIVKTLSVVVSVILGGLNSDLSSFYCSVIQFLLQDDYLPVTGDSPFKLRIIFELAKKKSDKHSIIVEHILSKILEIFPKNLKDFSKNSTDENLKSLIAAFCDLSCDCIAALEDDKRNLLKEKIDKNEKELWQTFVRACLKHGLKLKLAHVVQLLSKFCRKIYDSSNSVEIGQIYDMVCGHSSFVDTLLSTSHKELDVKLRDNVLELLLTLINCKGAIIRYKYIHSSIYPPIMIAKKYY